MSVKKTGVPSGAELRALRDARLAGQTDPAEEAVRHESSFLRNMAAAKDDFDWLVDHAAWTYLGFETFAEWWDARVTPLAAELGMRPTREMAKTVIEKVSEEQKALPKTQRRTQQQIAAMVGLDRSALANRDGSRSLPRENSRQSDLEEKPKTPLVEVLRDEIDSVEDKQQQNNRSPVASSTGDATDGGGPTANSGTSPAAGADDQADRSAPAVTPEPTEVPPHHGDAAREESEGQADLAGDETEPDAPASGEVDGQEQQDPAGVSGPAAPGPEQPEELIDEKSDDEGDQDGDALPPAPIPHPGDPAALIAWFADRFDEVDADACGPLLAGDDFELIGASLVRISDVVDLLATWPERTQT